MLFSYFNSSMLHLEPWCPVQGYYIIPLWGEQSLTILIVQLVSDCQAPCLLFLMAKEVLPTCLGLVALTKRVAHHSEPNGDPLPRGLFNY